MLSRQNSVCIGLILPQPREVKLLHWGGIEMGRLLADGERQDIHYARFRVWTAGPVHARRGRALHPPGQLDSVTVSADHLPCPHRR
jgi:hypothetical protein